jgi:hypothetical protein
MTKTYKVVPATSGKTVNTDLEVSIQAEGETIDGHLVFRITEYPQSMTTEDRIRYLRRAARQLCDIVGHDRVVLLDKGVEMVRLVPVED